MSDTLLLHVPVPLYRRDGQFLLEDQACNGLRLWADHFDRILLLAPLVDGPAPPSWAALTRVGPALERIEVVTVPQAYRPDRFLRALPAGIPLIRGLIERADYLGFAIGGLFGDWGAVGATIAQRMGKPYYIWTDRVESEVTRRTASSLPWRRRLRAKLEHRPMAWLERQLISRAALGLFHGSETFEAYAPHCVNPQMVHDVHVCRSDHISLQAMADKCAEVENGPLKIVYAGRADAMKGADDWLDTLEALEARGVDFQARWLGDGPALDTMRRRVAAGPLAARVELTGFVTERASVLQSLQAAHLMLFCHKTPESPRCLIEALVSGCPIVGYDGAYARDLISLHQGGVLVPGQNTQALADSVLGLVRDRAALKGLIGAAARDGARFDDVSVFAHRAALIKENLPRAR